MSTNYDIEWEITDDGHSLEAKLEHLSLSIEMDIFSGYSSFGWVVVDNKINITIMSNDTFTSKEDAKVNLLLFLNNHNIASSL